MQAADAVPAFQSIERMEQSKLYHYGCAVDRRLLPAGIAVVSFAVDPVAGMGPAALGLMLQMARAMAKRRQSDVMHVFYQNPATLHRAMCESQWRLLRAAGRPCRCA